MQRSGRVTSFVCLSEQDRSFRLNPISPPGGFGVLTVDGDRGELTTYVKDLRPLREDLPPGHFFYEGWLICADEKRERFISTGAFNTDECGQGKNFFVFDPANLRGTGLTLNQVKVLAITAEPQDGDPLPSGTVVLAGQVVLPAGLEFERAEQPVVECDAAVLPPEPAVPAAPSAAPPPPPADQSCSPDALPTPEQPEPAAPPEVVRKPVGSGAEAMPCPPGYTTVNQVQEVLEPLLEQIRDANATALIDFAQNSLVVTLRGLPAPAAFGYDPSTARRFNVYECWLGKSPTGDSVSLGYFRKIWHDTYRIQLRPGEPLVRYDTIIVTAADRAGGADPEQHKLFQGRYTAFTPVVPPTA